MQRWTCPLVGPVAPGEAELATNYFVVAFLPLSDTFEGNSRLELEAEEAVLKAQSLDFEGTSLWVQDLRQTRKLEQLSRHNPFVERAANFGESAASAMEFSHRLGSFQSLECHTLKTKLVEMEQLGTGRVLLSTFYSRFLAGAWECTESVEYLRNQGSLDETDLGRPSAVIPNYLNSPENCLAGSGFYSLCCINGCEGLMGHLERQIAAPTAAPARVAEVISSLQSDTVDAPWNVSAVLLARLDEIADVHTREHPQFCAAIEKDEAEWDTLTSTITQAIIYCNARREVDFLAEQLAKRDCTISADLAQGFATELGVPLVMMKNLDDTSALCMRSF